LSHPRDTGDKRQETGGKPKNSYKEHGRKIMVDVHLASTTNVAKGTIHAVPDKPGIAAEIFGK